jgi:2-keto-4-pentenoate hydratase/2-oxohepta-3-ene-1,7-dioic acid hydratase in catechol pathway
MTTTHLLVGDPAARTTEPREVEIGLNYADHVAESGQPMPPALAA